MSLTSHLKCLANLPAWSLGVGDVGPPVEGRAAHGDGVLEETLGHGGEHEVVDAGPAGGHAEDGHGGGVAAVGGDVRLDPSESEPCHNYYLIGNWNIYMLLAHAFLSVEPLYIKNSGSDISKFVKLSNYS